MAKRGLETRHFPHGLRSHADTPVFPLVKVGRTSTRCAIRHLILALCAIAPGFADEHCRAASERSKIAQDRSSRIFGIRAKGFLDCWTFAGFDEPKGTIA